MAAQVGYSVAGRSGCRVTPCAVYTVHMEIRSPGFLVEPQNQGRQFVSGLTSKSLGWFSLGWPQTRWQQFSPVWPQNQWRQFLLVWPQNRCLGFLDLNLKTGSYGPENRQGDLSLKITAMIS
jgi:hypothetical protein